MAGIHLHYQWMAEGVTEMIHHGITERDIPTRNVDQRIAHAVLIAERIMMTGYAAMTGINAHALAVDNGDADIEAPDANATAEAARTIAYAGSIARAAWLAGFLRIMHLAQG